MQPDRIMPNERWWVVFTDESRWGWWSIFSRPKSRHCFVLRVLDNDVVLAIDPLFSRAVTFGIRDKAPEMLKRYLSAGFDVIVYETGAGAYPSRRLVPRRGPLITCASFVSYLLGIEGWIVTPQSLKRRLLELGGSQLTKGDF